MREFVNRCFLCFLSVLVLAFSIKGDGFIVAFYAAAALSALGFWLLQGEDRIKKRILSILQVAVLLTVVFRPSLIGIIPVLVYDIILTQNVAALILVLISTVRALVEYVPVYEITGWQNGNLFSKGIVASCVLFSMFSIYLATCSRRFTELDRSYKLLRDDGEEQRRKLKHQNEALLEAKDQEIFTVQLEERNRIAREIHDNAGHTLSRAILQMGALLAIHKEEPMHSQLEAVRQTLDLAMNDMRTSVHALHDESVKLDKAIEGMLEPLYDSYEIVYQMDFGKDIPRDVKYAVIGILRECISNIIKHSKNHRIDILLQEHPGFYQVVVHDYNDPGAELLVDEKKESAASSLSEKTNDVGASLLREGKKEIPTSILRKRERDLDAVVIEDEKKNVNSRAENGEFKGSTGIGIENIYQRANRLGGTVRITQEHGFRVFVSIPK